MCLMTGRKNPEVAKAPITTYKIVSCHNFIDGRFKIFRSTSCPAAWSGKLPNIITPREKIHFASVSRIFDGRKFYEIGAGAIHSFENISDAVHYMTKFASFWVSSVRLEAEIAKHKNNKMPLFSFVTLQCTIPEGAKYYRGYCYNDRHGYCSDKLSLDKIVYGAYNTLNYSGKDPFYDVKYELV